VSLWRRLAGGGLKIALPELGGQLLQFWCAFQDRVPESEF
jgi:hypothetical protein